MADHDDFLTFLIHFCHFDMYLGHERAGRIEYLQFTSGCFPSHLMRNTMRTENEHTPFRYFLKIFHEYRPFFLQVFNYEAVMDNFMPYVDRCAIHRQRTLDDFNGPVNPRAESSRVRKQYSDHQPVSPWFVYKSDYKIILKRF